MPTPLNSRLTVAALTAIMADVPPTMRIIVGAPFCGDTDVLEVNAPVRSADGGYYHVLWMGAGALEKLKAHARTTGEDPFHVLAIGGLPRVLGITCEQFDGACAEHREFIVASFQSCDELNIDDVVQGAHA